MGLGHGEETQLPEVGNRPALIVSSASDTATSLPHPEDATKSPANPCVERSEHSMSTVLEIREPASQDCVESFDEFAHRLPIRASRPFSDGVLEFPQTLLARSPLSLLEVISEKVEAARRIRIDQLCFLGVQFQSSAFHQLSESG
jgi:hypothetical protein